MSQPADPEDNPECNPEAESTTPKKRAPRTPTPPPVAAPLPDPKSHEDRHWTKIIYFTPTATNKMNFHVSHERDFIGT